MMVVFMSHQFGLGGLFSIFLVSYNTKRYLIDQRRYKDSGSLLLTFYIFMAFVIFLRPVQFGFYIFLDQLSYFYVNYYFTTIIGLSVCALGLVMTFMMQELRTMISL